MQDSHSHYDRFEGQKALWDVLQASVASHPKQEVKALADITNELISHMMKTTAKANNGGAIEALPEHLTSAIEALTPTQKIYIGDITTLLLHLQRSASMQVSAEQQKTEGSNPFTKALQDMKEASHVTVDGALRALRLPVMDNVFTAHPTFIGDLEYTKRMRRLDRKIAAGDNTAIADELSALLDMPSIVDHPMKVADETQLMRHFLTNAYNSIPQIYAQADDALHQTGLAGTYDPSQLKLQMRFQSWGSSGDKDGNKNVNYHTTEDAIKTHRKTAVHFYQADLLEIMSALPADTREGYGYNAPWITCHKALDDISANTFSNDPQKMRDTLKNVRSFTEKVYKDMQTVAPSIAQQALGLMRKMDTFGLSMGDIEYRETAEVNAQVLDFIITPEDIAAAGVDINAEIYQKARKDGQKIISYSSLNSEDRTTVMNAVMNTLSTDEGKATFQLRIEQVLMQVPRSAKSRHHDYESPESVFYHSIKRLELAARNPDMIQNQVLAEAETPTEFKEMLALLKLTGNENHVRIVPLFEDPHVLANVGPIMRDIQTDPHVYAYLVNLSLNEWQERADKGYVPPLSQDIQEAIRALPKSLANTNILDEACASINAMIKSDETFRAEGMHWQLSDIIKTQVQMAHSDNSRRGGIVGARASIFKAHDDAARACGRLHLGMQFHEGGSHTDAFRMGVRSYRSLVNTYDNHEFMKCTVQGMDLAQIFSSPTTIEHFIGENIANSALVASQKRGTRGTSKRTQQAQRTPETMLREDKGLLTPFIDQIENYQNEYFKNPLLGYAMEQIFEYSKNKLAGTQGSRAPGRDGKTGDVITTDKDGIVVSGEATEGADTTDIDIAAERTRAPYLDPVKGTRTIGYSETLQHGGLNPNFVGFRQVRAPLLSLEYANATGHTAQTGLASLFQGKSDPEKLHTFYLHNPAVRDVVDRVAYAIAATDFEEVWERAQKAPGNTNKDTAGSLTYSHAVIEKDATTGKEKRIDHTQTYGESERITGRPEKNSLSEKATKKESMEGFISGLEVEYRDAAKFVLEAIHGTEVDINEKETSELRTMAQKSLLMYKDHFAAMDAAMGVAKTIENSTDPEVAKKALGKGNNPNHDIKNALNKMVHHVRDMATLVRAPFQAEWVNRGHKPERDHGRAIAA